MSLSAVSASDNVTDNAALASVDEDVVKTSEIETPLSTESNATDSSDNDTSPEEPVNVVSKFSAKDVTSTYGTKTKFDLKLLDKKGNPMKNFKILANVHLILQSAETGTFIIRVLLPPVE